VTAGQAIYGGYLDSKAGVRRPKVSEPAFYLERENCLMPPNNPGTLAMIGMWDNKKEKYIYGSRFVITAVAHFDMCAGCCIIGEVNASGLALIDRISRLGGQQASSSSSSRQGDASDTNQQAVLPREPVVIAGAASMSG